MPDRSLREERKRDRMDVSARRFEIEGGRNVMGGPVSTSYQTSGAPLANGEVIEVVEVAPTDHLWREHLMRIMEAADAYARAFREHGYGHQAQEARWALKGWLTAVEERESSR